MPTHLPGMNVMMYYITYVFTMAGETSNTLLVSSSIQYVINVRTLSPSPTSRTPTKHTSRSS